MKNYQIQRQVKVNKLGIVQVKMRVPFQNGTFSQIYSGNGSTVGEATQNAINQHQITGNEKNNN